MDWNSVAFDIFLEQNTSDIIHVYKTYKMCTPVHESRIYKYYIHVLTMLMWHSVPRTD